MATEMKVYDKHPVRCDVYRCREKAEYIISSDDSPTSASIRICGSCARQAVLSSPWYKQKRAKTKSDDEKSE